MSKILLISFLLLASCQYTGRQPKALTDSIEKLSRKADYKSLDIAEVYNFLNKYYLPHLDSLHFKRRIHIHPINGRDYKAIFQRNKADVQAAFYHDTAYLKATKVLLLPPDPILFNENFCWDEKRLANTIVVRDTLMVSSFKGYQHLDINEREAWHKKYGSGYMCISYPQYNANTKRLFIREWLENNDFCGTGRENEYSFTRSANGWTALNSFFYSKALP